jgi:hypothetical protein
MLSVIDRLLPEILIVVPVIDKLPPMLTSPLTFSDDRLAPTSNATDPFEE